MYSYSDGVTIVLPQKLHFGERDWQWGNCNLINYDYKKFCSLGHKCVKAIK